MWFRTALLLVLFLLVSRFLRSLLTQMSSRQDAGKVSPNPRHPTTPPTDEARTRDSGGATWPPGEITDVNYRESAPDESGSR